MIAPAASWIISQDGKAVRETFDPRTAEVAEELGFTVHTAGEWLAFVNGRAAA
jgi:hypothetical protein